MNEFTYHNPTKIFFGENAVENLGPQLALYGKKVLLTYGGGSILKNGIYEAVVAALKKAGKQVFELSGIMPNPRVTKVQEGIDLCKKEDIEFILAVGGGSVIDCSKAIAAGAKTEKEFWQHFYIGRASCEAALPIGVVLTLAATGSEMDTGSVITNWETKQKFGYQSPMLQPQFAVLDPTYTYSLPKEQLIYGTVDILSHLFELYFSPPDASNVSDDMAEGVMRNVLMNLEVALKDPRDYTARANLMWASSVALCGMIQLSKRQDWQAHEIEHAISAHFDIPHGAGLAIVHPNYMLYTYKNAPEKFARYAVRIWGVEPAGKSTDAVALEGIQRTKAYFKEIGAPSTLTQVGIGKDAFEKIADSTAITGGGYKGFTREDILNVLELCL